MVIKSSSVQGMSTRETPFAPGTPCWVDLLSSDPARSQEFYADLFGWTMTESGAEFGNYVTFSSAGERVAGLVPNHAESGAPDAWSTYLACTDATATLNKAVAGGAQVYAPVMQVGDLGSMAVLGDPAGATFGLWQAGTHTGFRRYNEPNSVIWDELQSKNYAVSRSFYADVFDWTYEQISDTDSFRYSQILIDGTMIAGVMDSSGFLPEAVPSHWTVYFNVDDIHAGAARVTELGGTVARPAESTPFGWLADCVDPTGAMFKLHAAPEV